MTSRRYRRWAVLGSGASALVLAVMSAAFACEALSSLTPSPSRGPAGIRVTVTGSGYNVTTGVPVSLRWNGTEGPELARVLPNPRGEISTSFVVPEAAPGFYVVIGVQRDARGVDAFGTPSRASFELTAGGAPAPTTTAPPATVAPPTTRRTVPPTTSTTSTTVAPTTSTSTTAVAPTTATSTTAPDTSVVALPAARTRDASGDLSGGAVAVAGALLLAVVWALGRTARGQTSSNAAG